MGYIYKITNKVNHKIYIGLTQLTVEERWDSHIKTAHAPSSKDYNALFKKAIRKYGVDGFTVETIDEADSLEELKEKEIYWIAYYHSYAFDADGWGYNSTRGGDSVSELCKRAIVQCDVLSGKMLARYDSIKDGERAIKTRIDKVGEKEHTSGGYCFLYEDNVKELNEGEIINLVHSLYSYLVYQLDLDGNFIALHRNTTEAANAVSSSQGNLISCCLGNRRMCKGFQWAYQRDIDKRINQPVRAADTFQIPVIQYSLAGNFIKEWKNARTAAKELSLQDSHISSCCKGKRNQTGGYQWRYADEELKSVPPITTKRKVICIETSEVFDTVNHAAKHFGYAHATVKNSCEGKNITKPYHFAWYDREEDLENEL